MTVLPLTTKGWGAALAKATGSIPSTTKGRKEGQEREPGRSQQEAGHSGRDHGPRLPGTVSAQADVRGPAAAVREAGLRQQRSRRNRGTVDPRPCTGVRTGAGRREAGMGRDRPATKPGPAGPEGARQGHRRGSRNFRLGHHSDHERDCEGQLQYRGSPGPQRQLPLLQRLLVAAEPVTGSVPLSAHQPDES